MGFYLLLWDSFRYLPSSPGQWLWPRLLCCTWSIYQILTEDQESRVAGDSRRGCWAGEGSSKPWRRWGKLLVARISMNMAQSLPFLPSPASYRDLASLSISCSHTTSVLLACEQHKQGGQQRTQKDDQLDHKCTNESGTAARHQQTLPSTCKIHYETNVGQHWPSGSPGEQPWNLHSCLTWRRPPSPSCILGEENDNISVTKSSWRPYDKLELNGSRLVVQNLLCRLSWYPGSLCCFWKPRSQSRCPHLCLYPEKHRRTQTITDGSHPPAEFKEPSQSWISQLHQPLDHITNVKQTTGCINTRQTLLSIKITRNTQRKMAVLTFIVYNYTHNSLFIQ